MVNQRGKTVKSFQYFLNGVEKFAYISTNSGDLNIGHEFIEKKDVIKFYEWLKGQIENE